MYPCPWHDDKTPSMKVFQDGMYCFTCKQGWDIFDFITRMTGKTLSEILKENSIDYDPIKALEIKQSNLEKRQAELEEKMAKIERDLISLRTDRPYIKYNKSMEDVHREQWRKCGVEDFMQDTCTLGVAGRYGLSLTIPYFGYDKQVHGIQYRVIHPDREKWPMRYVCWPHYTFPLYVANIYTQDWDNVFLLEGAKKAIVFWQTLKSPTANVVASPSLDLTDEHVKQLEKARTIYYIPDPFKKDDKTTRKVLNKNWEKLGGKERDIRFINVTGKIDDMVLAGLGTDDLRGLVRNARRL